MRLAPAACGANDGFFGVATALRLLAPALRERARKKAPPSGA